MSGHHPWPPPKKGQHASDCAVHNEPALPHGECDCGAERPAASVLVEARATFSPCRRWRYSLTREIADPQFGCLDEDERGGTLTFVGLNPSTADETADDPTIRRCVRFARDWGFDRLKMMNLYALRSTDPRGLWLADDPVGPENDHALSLAFGGSEKIIVAWGANARPDRLASFAETFHGWPFWALGLTKDGAPRHPLYMRADVQPVPYDVEALRAA